MAYLSGIIHQTSTHDKKQKAMLRFLLFLLLLPISLKSQIDPLTELDIIQTLTTYRSKLLKENVHAADSLRVLEKKWGELDPKDEAFEALTINIIFLKSVYDFTTPGILRIVKKRYGKKRYGKQELVEKITEGDIEIILKNSELLDLVLDEAVKPSYPFPINPKSRIFTELSFYQIESGQKIGELGAGNGTFSVILAMATKEVQIFVNELNQGYVDYIQTKIQKNAQLLDVSKIQTIKGSKSETKFPENELDRIVIRNAFHHFSKKEKMLKSINAALKGNGKLCLYEPILGKSNRKDVCVKALERSYLVKVIEENGFILEEEKDLESGMLFRFRKR
jgi:SAM-dependent methyltransferase